MTSAVTAARLHLLTWRPMVGWPWAVLAVSLGINLVVQSLLSDNDRSSAGTGGLASVYVVAAIWAQQTVTQVFPFALGLGVTRRDFALGTAYVLSAQAFLYAALLTVLRYVEGATDGFGVQLHFFRVPVLRQDSVLPQLLVYAAPFLLLGTVAQAVAVVQHRWRTTGLFLLIVAVTAAGGAGAALVVWTDGWASISNWFADAPALTTLVLLPFAATITVATAGFATLRRATP